MMIEIWSARNYYAETLIMAAQIFDRFMLMVTSGLCPFDYGKVPILVCTCIVIAAKFEQPKKPSFNNMILAMTDVQGQLITTADMMEMEQQIII